MDTTFRPREPYRAKSEIVTVTAAIPTLTANTTTTVHVPTPARRSFLLSASIQCSTIPADADGAITATVKRYDVSGAAAVSMSSALDCEALVALTATRFTMLSGSTRIKAREDTLRVDFVNDSAAIDTQFANGFVVLELALLD